MQISCRTRICKCFETNCDQLPNSTIDKVLHRKLQLRADKVQLFQELHQQEQYKLQREQFTVNMLESLNADEGFRTIV